MFVLKYLVWILLSLLGGVGLEVHVGNSGGVYFLFIVHAWIPLPSVCVCVCVLGGGGGGGLWDISKIQ